MTDIVERLRDIEMSNGQQVTPFMMMTARKAADEIERLRSVQDRDDADERPLVERLRDPGRGGGSDVYEAAEEIERLRELIRQFADALVLMGEEIK